MLTGRSFLFLVTALLLYERADEAYASGCVEPGLPCLVPFTASCIDLLTKGEVTTENSLRDDVVNGGCILCVPPGGVWTGPNPCLSCGCFDGEIGCVALAGGYVEAAEGTAPCPASEYEDFTAFSVMATPCPSHEEIELTLDCGAAARDEKLGGVVRIVSSKASVMEPTFTPSSSPSGDQVVWVTSTESVRSSTGTKQHGSISVCSVLIAWFLCLAVRREL